MLRSQHFVGRGASAAMHGRTRRTFEGGTTQCAIFLADGNDVDGTGAVWQHVDALQRFYHLCFECREPRSGVCLSIENGCCCRLVQDSL